jgi:hypothetical protein
MYLVYFRLPKILLYQSLFGSSRGFEAHLKQMPRDCQAYRSCCLESCHCLPLLFTPRWATRSHYLLFTLTHPCPFARYVFSPFALLQTQSNSSNATSLDMTSTAPFHMKHYRTYGNTQHIHKCSHHREWRSRNDRFQPRFCIDKTTVRRYPAHRVD